MGVGMKPASGVLIPTGVPNPDLTPDLIPDLVSNPNPEVTPDFSLSLDLSPSLVPSLNPSLLLDLTGVFSLRSPSCMISCMRALYQFSIDAGSVQV